MDYVTYGDGLFNKFLNSKFMPELHVPHFQYLGPFTNLEKRLARGDPGINPLDQAAKEHDIFYANHRDSKSRHLADQVLENKAWERVKASDSSVGEKVAAYLTTNAMKIKRKLGMGCSIKKKKILSRVIKKIGGGCSGKQNLRKNKKKTKSMKQIGRNLTFSSLVKKAKKSLKGTKAENIQDTPSLHKAVETAISAIGSRKGAVVKGFKRKNGSRIIPIPKTGGILPLIPILAGISKVGAIAGGASTIVNAIREIMSLRKNKDSSSASKKIGEGMFLAPYRKGYGLFLSPQPACFPKN